MTKDEIVSIRLQSQRLLNYKFKTSTDGISWLGAIQSQDFPAAKWSLGLRTENTNNSIVQKLYDDGKIIRTHVMRPTWHFISPENVTWMQHLTSIRVKQIMNHYNKKLELTESVFKKTNSLLVKWLKNNNFLTRQEIKRLLEKEGIETNVQRLAHIVMWAELDGLVVNGPLKGKQFTYALLNERAPQQKKLSKESSLKELAKLYFQSHGPALVSDFAWWSGLTTREAKEGVEFSKPKLVSEIIDNKEYWFFENKINNPTMEQGNNLFLLSVYDEYFIAYKDRSLILDNKYKNQMARVGNALLTSLVAIDGTIVGTWKRKIGKANTVINLQLFRQLNAEEKQMITKEVEKYSEFFQTKTTLQSKVV